jgi:hypothetical protein
VQEKKRKEMDENKKQAEATVVAMKTAEAMNGVATALTPAATDDTTTTAAELASPAYTARKVEECPDCKELVHGLQQHRSTCQAIKDLRAKAAEVVRTMAITSPAGSSSSNGSGPAPSPVASSPASTFSVDVLPDAVQSDGAPPLRHRDGSGSRKQTDDYAQVIHLGGGGGDDDGTETVILDSGAASAIASGRVTDGYPVVTQAPGQPPGTQTAYPIDDAKLLTTFDYALLFVSTMVLVACLVGATLIGNTVYNTGFAYWPLDQDITQPVVPHTNQFYISVAAVFVAFMYPIMLGIKQLRTMGCTPEARAHCMAERGHSLLAEYDTSESVIRIITAAVAYPLLAAYCGERDVMRLLLISFVATTWNLYLFVSSYMASPERCNPSNLIAVRQRQSHGFWLGMAALCTLIPLYVPIIMQSQYALPHTTNTFIKARVQVLTLCIILDVIKFLINLVRVSPKCRAGCCCLLECKEASRQITEKLLACVTFSAIAILGCFV